MSKIKSLIFCAVIFLSSIMLIEVSAGPQSTEFLSYENTETDFKISYPNEWSKTETGVLTIPVILVSPSENSDDDYSEYLVITVEDLLVQTSLSAYMESTISDYETKFDLLQVIEEKETSLAEQPSQTIKFTTVDDFQNPLTGNVSVLIEDNFAYSILFLAETSKYDSYLPTFSQMLDSFELTNIQTVKSDQDDTVQESDDTVQESDDTVQESDDTVQESDDTVEITDEEEHDEKNAMKKKIISPRKQMQKGTSAIDVICNEGKELMLKTSTDAATCVKSTSVQKLIERGWGTLAIN